MAEARPGPVQRAGVTGVVLAGGAGRRMQGLDKGLQAWRGRPMVEVALERLAPQVATVLISANRHLDEYRRYGWPIVQDRLTTPDEPHAGPLAGLEAALAACHTPWLLTVPCDSPGFPLDLREQLARRLVAEDAELAIACTASTGAEPARRHPVFCLLSTALASSLRDYLRAGGRRLDAWTAMHQRALVEFADAAAFRNLNTLDDLGTGQRP